MTASAQELLKSFREKCEDGDTLGGLLTLKQMTDFGCTDELDYTAMYYAIYNEKPIFVEYILQLGVMPSPDEFLLAVRFGNIELIQLFCKYNYGPNVAGKHGFTALHEACTYNNPDILRLLLDWGADTEAKNSQGETAFLLVAQKLHTDCIKILIDCSNIHATDNHGHNAFHHAAMHNNFVVFDILMNAGVDIHAKAENGWTPLHYASWMDYRGCISQLLTHGADPNALTNDGQTPYDLAKLKDHHSVCMFLKIHMET